MKKNKATATESEAKPPRKSAPQAESASPKNAPAKTGKKGRPKKTAEKPPVNTEPAPVAARSKKSAVKAVDSGVAPVSDQKRKAAEVTEEPANDPAKLETIKNLVHKPKHTPAIFKLPSKKLTPVLFTLEDVRELLKNRGELKQRGVSEAPPEKTTPTVAEAKPVELPPPARESPAPRQRIVGAANLADILGFVPVHKKPSEGLVREVPKKWAGYYKMLMDLRQHLREKLNIHTEDTLLKTGREDAGDASAYSQHIADAGTDSFDRDFALGLLSNEKEALYEVEQAIERIFKGTYGICEITGQPIAKERLEAVPFTRFSLEGQAEYEKNNRRQLQRNSYFAELTGDEAGAFSDDSSE